MSHHREEIQKGSQEWFEMQDILDGLTHEEHPNKWVPLKMVPKYNEDKEWYAGFIGEKTEVETLIIPENGTEQGGKLRINDIRIYGSSRGIVTENGNYRSAGTYLMTNKDKAERLILVRGRSSKEKEEWMISQDLITTFELKQEGDVWVAINDDYKEVIKMERNDEGDVYAVLMDKEHLKDYLCARNSKMYIYTWVDRTQIIKDFKNIQHINWKQNKDTQFFSRENFISKKISNEKIIYVKDSIHNIECHVSPLIGFVDTFWVQGIFHNTQFVSQGEKSYIVRGDKREKSTARFIMDETGKKDTAYNIHENNPITFICFNPNVINAILSTNKSAILKWKRYDWGCIEYQPEWDVDFGINDAGLVNIRPKSLLHLTEERQNVWAIHSVKREGAYTPGVLTLGFPKEKDMINDAKAPEVAIPEQCTRLNEIINKKLGFCLFKEINQSEFDTIHRFEAVTKNNEEGLLNLANKINKAIIERINADKIKQQVQSRDSSKIDDNLGSLKLLETLLSLYIDKECKGKECQNIPCSYKLLSELYGVYELRNNATHIPSKDDIAFGRKLCRINKDAPLVIQAEQLMQSVVECLSSICECCEDIEI